MIEAYFDDGTAFTVSNAIEWMTFLGETEDFDINFYAGVIEKSEFQPCLKSLKDIDSDVSTRLQEIITAAMDSETEHVVLD